MMPRSRASVAPMRRRAIASVLAAAAGIACGPTPPAFAGVWTGEWIWAPEPTRELAFRRVFTVERAPAEAWLVITADNIYTARVNGREVGSDRNWMQVETWPITDRIRVGANLATARVLDPGPDAGGLLAEIVLIDKDGLRTIVPTDGSWRMTTDPADGWDRDIEFDTSDWQDPELLGAPPVGPWGGLPYPEPGPKIAVSLSDPQVEVTWPDDDDDRPRVEVEVEIARGVEFPVTGRIRLQFERDGESVVEVWRDAAPAVGEWTVGERVRVELPALRWPRHAPAGVYELVVAGEGYRSNAVRWSSPRPAPKGIDPVRMEIADVRCAHQPDSGEAGILEVEFSWRTWTPIAPFGGFLALVRDADGVLREVIPIDTRLPDRREMPPGRHARSVHARLSQPLAPGPHSIELRPAIPWDRSPTTRSFTVETGPDRPPKAIGNGTFRDRFGAAHFWYVNRAHTLVWDGVPHLPAGGMYLSTFLGRYGPGDPEGSDNAFARDVERLTQLRNAGVRDLYLNPCRAHADSPTWIWQRLVDLFEELGFRYAWQISEPHEYGRNREPGRLFPFTGYAVSRGGYAAEPVAPGETASAWIADSYFARYEPGHRVYAIGFTGDTAAWSRRADVEPGKDGVRASTTAPADGPEVARVLFVPELTYQGDMHDYWTSLGPEWLERFHSFAAALQFGPGFRGFLDPLDNEQSFRDMPHLAPSMDAFRDRYSMWLQGRYRDLDALAAAWRIDPAPPSWADAAALVPAGVWPADSDRGWWFSPADPEALYRVDLAGSQAWYDLLECRGSDIRWANRVAADAIKDAHDVPVILKLTENPGFTNDREVGGFDALGMEAYGTPPELTRGCGGGVYARAAQSHRTMWELVTETGRAAPGETGVGYPTPVTMIRDLASMGQIGAKGAYIFYLNSFGDSPGSAFHDMNLFMDARQLRWLGIYGRILDRAPGIADYVPRTHFAFPSRWPGERAFGARIPDFETPMPHVSVRNRNGAWVVPVRDPSMLPTDFPDTRLLVDIDGEPAAERFAADLERAAPGLEVEPLPAATGDGLTAWGEIVRELDLPGADADDDYILDVLGCRILPLGPALEGIVVPGDHDGGELFLWNLTGEPVALEVIGIDADRIEGALETEVRDAGRCRVVLPPGATREVVMPAAGVRLRGVNHANLGLLLPRLRERRRQATDAGIDSAATMRPDPSSWRQAQAEIDILEEAIWNADNTAVAYRIDGARIDGDLAEWRNREPSVRFTRRIRGRQVDTIEPPAGTAFWAGWDDEYLYIAARIADPEITNPNRHEALWNGDALEVAVEFRLEPARTHFAYDADTFQFLFAPVSAMERPAVYIRGMDGGQTWRDPEFVPMTAFAKDMGWTVEAAIPWERFAPEGFDPSAPLGFVVAVDRAAGGGRTDQLTWRGGGDFSRDRASFARLRLEPAAAPGDNR